MTFQWYWPDANPETWDFDGWRERYPTKEIISEQSGRPDPLPLLAPETTRANWEEEIAPGWRDVSDRVLGTLTDTKPAEPEAVAMAPAFSTTHYVMQRYRYALTPDEEGYGWLLTPHEPLVPDAVVLALHPTACNGKDQIVGLDETANPTNGGPYARELAERGIAVFAPDAIAFGERQMGHRNARYRSAWGFFDTHPDGSVMAKMTFDTSRELDVLQSLGFSRFGSIGHSHGAYWTLFAMIADERIEAGVMSCGLNALRDDPGPERWWRATALIPRLGLGAEDAARTPIDFHHWLALVAPRPVLITGGTEDTIFPNMAPLASRLEEVRAVYGLYDREGDLHVDIGAGGHVFRPRAREDGYQMLVTTLTNPPQGRRGRPAGEADSMATTSG